MAEGIFRQIIHEREMPDVTCRSCGLYAYAGDPATPAAVRAAQAFGADIAAHRSTPMQPYLIDETDWFLCMTPQHAALLRQIAPETKISVLGGGIPRALTCKHAPPPPHHAYASGAGTQFTNTL